MAEVASAFVALVPSYRGGTSMISKEISPAAEGAGKEAGKSFGSSMLSGITKLGIGTAVAGIFTSAVSQAGNKSKLAAMLGLSPGEAKTAASVAGKLYSGAFADNLDEANDAIKSVASSLTGVGNGKELERITGKALSLSKAFGTDVQGNVNAASTLIKTGLAKNADEAFDIIAVGSQNGADKAGDLLDTFDDYGPQLKQLGLTGASALGLITQGLQAGAKDSDRIGDALHEFAVTAGQDNATVAAAYTSLGLNAKQMIADVAQGGAPAKAALTATLGKLREFQGTAKASAAVTALFAGAGEDLGDSLYSLNPATAGAAKGLDGVKGASDRVNVAMGQTTPPFETLKRQAIGVVGSIASHLVPAVEALSPVISAVGGPLTYAAVGIGGLVVATKAGQAIKGAATSTIAFTKTLITGATAARGYAAAGLASARASGAAALANGRLAAAQTVATGRMIVCRTATFAISAATKAYAAAQWLLNAAMSANPLGIIITLIAGLVAAIVIAYNKSTTFRNIVQGAFRAVATAARFVWSVVKTAFSGVMAVIRLVGSVVKTVILAIVGIWRTQWNVIKTVVTAVWNGIKTVVTGAINAVWGIIQRVGRSISGAWSAIWNGLKNTASTIIDKIKSIVGGIWDGITGGLKSALNGAIGLLNSGIGFINDKLIDTANKVPFVNIPHIPKIPELAEGGIVPATHGGRLVRVAEGGQAEAVIPLDRAAEFFGKGGDGRDAPVVAGDLVIQGVDDPRATARRTARELSKLAA